MDKNQRQLKGRNMKHQQYDDTTLDAAWKQVERNIRTSGLKKPAPGFNQRWQARLAKHKDATKRKEMWLLIGISLIVAFGFLGFFSTSKKGSILQFIKITFLGFLLSGFVEVLQLFTIDRSTSITDLFCNMGGAFAGAAFASVVFNGYQVAGYLTSTPPIDIKLDPRDTIVSIGFLLDIYTDPTPYRDLLIDFVNKCSKEESFTLSMLEKIVSEFLRLKDEEEINIKLDNLVCNLTLNRLD